ncbi:hypothetical protein L342_4155 [Escherichia coli CE516]|nr:hypothetical protein L342_4155 [Escherichia coli CE516]
MKYINKFVFHLPDGVACVKRVQMAGYLCRILSGIFCV